MTRETSELRLSKRREALYQSSVIHRVNKKALQTIVRIALSAPRANDTKKRGTEDRYVSLDGLGYLEAGASSFAR